MADDESEDHLSGDDMEVDGEGGEYNSDEQ